MVATCFFFFLMSGVLPALAQDKKTILFIDSYHPGYLWSEDVKSGLNAYFHHNDPGYNLYMEYMDTKRHDSADLFPILFELYKKKYMADKLDVVIASDNNALSFLRRYRDCTFPGTPVVFCGVNHFNDRMLDGFDKVTGVVEEPSFRETMELALTLFPGTKKIYGIGGSAETATANLAGIRQVVKDAGMIDAYVELHNLTMAAYKTELQKISKDSILLYVGLYRDVQGKTLSGARESLEFVRKYTDQPVFSMWSQHLPFCLGGVMISGREQSRNAAQMALSVLEGRQADAIPLMRESPNRPMFNYNELVRFGLTREKLPEDSIVINLPPPSFYSQYQKEILGILMLFVCLVLLLISLLFTLHYRNIALKKKNRLWSYVNSIQDSMPSVIIGVDLSLTVTQWNQSAVNRSGIEKQDAIGRPLEALYHFFQKDFQPVQDAILARKDLVKLNLSGRRNGDDIFEDVLVFPLVSDDEAGAVIRIDDVTERNRIHELTEQSESLKRQLYQAQKMESVGRLAGGIAHDFNNMLSIILGNAEMLMEDIKEDRPSISVVKEIQKAARRSADLTRQLLAFARKQTIAPETINLNTAIEGMLKILSRLIGEDIELSWHPEPELWHVKMDPSQLDQMLANLCVNARDAIRDVGKVIIETDNVQIDDYYCLGQREKVVPGDYVLVCISDNGCGMSRETIDKLFEPFFTTKKIGEGTGLGLATVYGIMKQNNGFINVYSEPGQGSTFKLYSIC